MRLRRGERAYPLLAPPTAGNPNWPASPIPVCGVGAGQTAATHEGATELLCNTKKSQGVHALPLEYDEAFCEAVPLSFSTTVTVDQNIVQAGPPLCSAQWLACSVTRGVKKLLGIRFISGQRSTVILHTFLLSITTLSKSNDDRDSMLLSLTLLTIQ